MNIRISPRILLYFLLILVGVSGVAFTFFFPSPQGFYLSIVAAAIAGFGVAVNIYQTKKSGAQLVCPTGSNCNAVVNSRYASFFGVSLEYWGMFYYGLIILSYLGLIFFPAAFTPAMILAVVTLSVLAGLFSLYLLFVQAVLLREWCIWCILSALLSLGICMFSLISADSAVEFMVQFDYVLWVIRSFGLALGVGGVTSAAMLFGQSLDDESIDEDELTAIKSVFELVWVGLGLVIAGQFGLYVAYPEVFATSGVFVAQMASLSIAVISGAALMIVYAPFLTYVPFGDSTDTTEDSFAGLRKPVLAIGAVVFVSWYFTFFTGFISGVSAALLLTILLVILTAVILGVLVWDAHTATDG